MPQKKKSRTFHGIHHVLNYHPEVGKFARERPGVFGDKEEFLVLVKAAIEPWFFHSENKLLESFGRIYSRWPDDVLAFMCVVRKVLNKRGKTQAGTVMKFLCNHDTVSIESRRQVYDNGGKCVAITVKNLLDDGEKRISVINLHPDKIRELSHPKLKVVDSLLDKELAALLKVNSESVKKARQELGRISGEIAFWDNPEIVDYMKTGKMTPECERLWEAYTKGKN